jgi:hypothetical protein
MIAAKQALKQSNSINVIDHILKTIEDNINSACGDGRKHITFSFLPYEEKDVSKVKKILELNGYVLPSINYGWQTISW